MRPLSQPNRVVILRRSARQCTRSTPQQFLASWMMSSSQNEYDGPIQVRSVGHYKHLGGFITGNLSLHPEIRTRSGQAMAQLQALKKQVLGNGALPLQPRRHVLTSIVPCKSIPTIMGIYEYPPQCHPPQEIRPYDRG